MECQPRHGVNGTNRRPRSLGLSGIPKHLQTAAADPQFRTRLCQHWSNSGGTSCPMKKKGRCGESLRPGVQESRS